MPTPYYDHGGITIYHGDCREIMPSIADASVDLVLTDPPYGHNNNNGDLAHRREEALGLVKRGVAKAGEARPIANDGPEANELVRWMFGHAARVIKPGCCCCCCCGGGGPDPQFARWSLWLDEVLNFKQMVVWDKGGLGMGWHYRRNYETILVGEKPGSACHWYGGNTQANVVRIPGLKPTADGHPTPKPPELMGLFVRLHSQPGELILDPFAGAGTTLRAAKDMGRRAIGIEIEERYCEIAAKRMAQETLFEIGG
jgi:site-specific DNA-methyltransferase (adenine-specific)